MKKLVLLLLLMTSLGASAHSNWGNNWWGNNDWWGDDNGIFGFNPYEYWEPQWYFEEMENFVDEFDDWDNDHYGYGYNPYYRPYGYAPNGYVNTPYGPGRRP